MEIILLGAPKVELHAHLNGSLNIGAIRELGQLLYGENSSEFLDLTNKFIDFNDVHLNECFKKFKFMHELTATPKGLEEATLMCIRDFSKDNVIYLELRTTPKANKHMSKRSYLECVLNAVAKAQVLYPTVRVKVLPSIDRSQPVSSAHETVDIVIKLREKYLDLMPGIDFSGNPHCGVFEEFIPLLRKVRECGLKLALHCAEIEKPKEIAEMVDFGMDRCGHGTFLSKAQLKQLAERQVPIECCLTSNIKCGTVSSYDDHHFRDIFVARDAVVLCTDDSGVFDTTLTQEFMLARKTFALTKWDCRELILHGVAHAFASNAEKSALRKQVEKYFGKA